MSAYLTRTLITHRSRGGSEFPSVPAGIATRSQRRSQLNAPRVISEPVRFVLATWQRMGICSFIAYFDCLQITRRLTHGILVPVSYDGGGPSAEAAKNASHRQ
jgi:hypothetical protein